MRHFTDSSRQEEHRSTAGAPVSSQRGPSSAQPPHARERRKALAPPVRKTVIVSLIAPFVRHALRTGWSDEALTDLCVRHGIHRAAFDDLTARVPQAGASAVLGEICAQCGDENLGIHLAREADPSWMSIPGILGMNLASVREAFELGSYYGRRLNPTAPGVGIHKSDDGLLHIIHSRDPHEASWPRQFVEADVATVLVLVRRFTGVDIKAVCVSFPHAAPADVGPHVALFGTTDIRFEAAFAGLALPASILDIRHQNADPGLAAYLRHHADALIEKIGGDDIGHAVRQSLRAELERGAQASLGGAARTLKMTSRTLQRRLADAGVRFGALLEQVRCEMAIDLLQRPCADFQDIAERVGFSDARSLRRALKRRTGRTPSALRRHDDRSA